MPQAMSASGARYANKDETFVVLEQGRYRLRYQGKDGKETYPAASSPNDRACLARPGMFSKANLRMSATTTVAATRFLGHRGLLSFGAPCAEPWFVLRA